MATRINITQVQILISMMKVIWLNDGKNGNKVLNFFLTASGTDSDSQMRALLFHCAGPDVQDIFMHLEDVGTTHKAAMDALNNHLEPKKNVVFERHVFV